MSRPPIQISSRSTNPIRKCSDTKIVGAHITSLFADPPRVNRLMSDVASTSPDMFSATCPYFFLLLLDPPFVRLSVSFCIVMTSELRLNHQIRSKSSQWSGRSQKVLTLAFGFVLSENASLLIWGIHPQPHLPRETTLIWQYLSEQEQKQAEGIDQESRRRCLQMIWTTSFGGRARSGLTARRVRCRVRSSKRWTRLQK